MIRLATPDDAPAVHAIYAPVVRDTAISFEVVPPTVEEIGECIAWVLAKFPWLLCELDGGLGAGYAYATTHRERAAYQWNAEVTVYVHPQARRRGVARALYTSLFALLRLQGICNVYAGITLPNAGSVGLHTSLGFRPIGIHHSTGFKLGRWHDVGWYELALQPHPAEPPPLRALRDVLADAGWERAMQSGNAHLSDD